MFAMLFLIIKIIFVLLCISTAIILAIFVPLAIFTIPYSLWVGSQNLSGRYKELRKESLGASIRHSFQLYKSWIFKIPPTFS